MYKAEKESVQLAHSGTCTRLKRKYVGVLISFFFFFFGKEKKINCAF